MNDDYRKTALDLLMDIMPTIKRLVERISMHDRHLADQVRRAVSRAILGHGEADGNFKGNRRLRLEEAYGSLHETRRALKLAAAWDYVPRREVDPVDAHLDRVGAMTWRRMHPRA